MQLSAILIYYYLQITGSMAAATREVVSATGYQVRLCFMSTSYYRAYRRCIASGADTGPQRLYDRPDNQYAACSANHRRRADAERRSLVCLTPWHAAYAAPGQSCSGGCHGDFDQSLQREDHAPHERLLFPEPV